jgi:hypothetical protein
MYNRCGKYHENENNVTAVTISRINKLQKNKNSNT